MLVLVLETLKTHYSFEYIELPAGSMALEMSVLRVEQMST